MNDNVEHPAHYTSHPSGVECIDITRHHDFAIGNAIKYLWRAGLKGDGDRAKEIEDLRKAVWYVEDKIAQLEDAEDDQDVHIDWRDPELLTLQDRINAMHFKLRAGVADGSI